MLIIKDLHIFDTKKTKTILSLPFLEVPQGSCCLIAGNSGSGKTMFLKTLANQHHEIAGNIIIENRIYESFTDQELSEMIQFLNQSYTLFTHLTVKDQLLQPLLLLRAIERKEALEKIKTYVDFLELKDHTEKYPHQLSGGQRQRFALIQKLLLEPKILLLDEPTSGLDKKNKGLMIKLLKKEQLSRNITILMASHDKEIVETEFITQKYYLI
jgi:ABC-type lipoprotein export system ATPase subunit